MQCVHAGKSGSDYHSINRFFKRFNSSDGTGMAVVKKFFGFQGLS